MSPAATSSITARATSATTSVARVAPVPREADPRALSSRSTRVTLVFMVAMAGTRPKTTPVTIAITSATLSMGQLSAAAGAPGSYCSMSATSPRPPASPKPRPTTALRSDSTSPSVSICVTSCARPAPIAVRIATSR